MINRSFCKQDWFTIDYFPGMAGFQGGPRRGQ